MTPYLEVNDIHNLLATTNLIIGLIPEIELVVEVKDKSYFSKMIRKPSSLEFIFQTSTNLNKFATVSVFGDVSLNMNQLTGTQYVFVLNYV